MRRHAITLGAVLAAVLGPFGGTATARAAGEVPHARLVISVGSVTRTLTCYPEGGDHPRAAEACAELQSAGGAVERVPPMPGTLCIALWDPVKISVVGRWPGTPVEFSQTASNSACGAISHGHVFLLDG